MEVENLARAIGSVEDSGYAAPASDAEISDAGKIRENDGLPTAGRRASLTARQAAFAQHYVACGNGAAAARRAGYSVANSRFIARDNLKKPAVRHRIRALAAAREEQLRDEAGYLVMMLNAAMQMALRQEQPHAMIRALGAMARMTGLDRPAATPPVPAIQAEADSNVDDDTGDNDRWLAHVADDRAGLIQEAVLEAAAAADLIDPIAPGGSGENEYAPDEFPLNEQALASRVPPDRPDHAPVAQVAAGGATKHHITPHPEEKWRAGDLSDRVAASFRKDRRRSREVAGAA